MGWREPCRGLLSVARAMDSHATIHDGRLLFTCLSVTIAANEARNSTSRKNSACAPSVPCNPYGPLLLRSLAKSNAWDKCAVIPGSWCGVVRDAHHLFLVREKGSSGGEKDMAAA